MTPFVSIIIPCRNEEKFIGKCLDSIIAQDFPKDKLEVLVVDGMSEDKTRETIEKFKIKNEKLKVKVLDNPKKYTPFALNIGIKNADGDIVIRMDGHAVYNKDYVSKCLRYSQQYKVDNVGGIIKTTLSSQSVGAKAIALALSSVFGAGGSYFRISSKSPKLVDTVFGGCYKREVFERIGLFNENLIRSQDLEFNLRLKRAGGKILLVPDIVSYYYSKSNLWDFFKHNLIDGVWAIYPLKFVKMPFSLRHYIPLLFVSSLIGSILLSIFFTIFRYLFILIIGLYFLLSFYFSAKITIREKNLRYFFIMPIVFANRHIGYGLGSIWGFFKLLL